MKEANPKLIGLFVIGGIVLAAAALVMLSSQDYFTPRRLFVAYFQQTVNGLHVGAPVRFRGIPVGQVIQIDGVYNPETGHMMPRVTIEFHPESMKNAKVKEGEYTLLPLLLESGMRASLKSSSLLTGKLYVSLDFHPQVPERYLGAGNNDPYPELPTIDSGLAKTIDKISDLPIEELFASVESALAAAEGLLRNPDIAETLALLPTLLSDTDAVVVDLGQFIDRDVAPMVSDVGKTLAVTRDSLHSLTTLITEDSLVQVNSTLTALQGTLQLVQKRLSEDDVLIAELRALLHELNRTARSFRELADTLEENPEVLLRGKKTP